METVIKSLLGLVFKRLLVVNETLKIEDIGL